MSQEVNRRGLYYVIPAVIMDSKELEPGDKLLYALLSGYSDHEGKCFPSDKHLSERLNEPERTIKGRVKKLSDKGLISRETKSCASNPFKKFRIITVHSEFKKSLRRAVDCTIEGATHCTIEVPPIALIESEAILESKENSLVPSSDVTKKNFPSKEKEIPKEAYEISQFIWDHVLKIHPNHKPPNLEKWAETVFKCHKNDHRSWDDLWAVVRFALEIDRFWAKTLQSPESLRRNFDAISIKMKPVNTVDSRIKQNLETAYNIKTVLSKSNESHLLIIHKNSVSRQSGDSISFDLPPETFEDILVNWFKLVKKS